MFLPASAPSVSVTRIWKSAFVIEKPVQVEESLIDHVLVRRSLVFNDYRATVFIDTQRINPSLMLPTCGMLARKQLYA